MLQLNVGGGGGGGILSSKLSVIEHLATTEKTTCILFQETHMGNNTERAI